MIRFRNPGTKYTTQIQVFKELYKEYKDAPSFNLGDMAAAIAKMKLMTAYGYAGEAALQLSNTENNSMNSTMMNSKMYAEVFRLLGWTASAGSRPYPLVFTYIGEHAAVADDVMPLYEQCVLGINNPQEIMKVTYNEKVRFFKAALFSLEDLDGIMYRHELCVGPMSVDDLDADRYEQMIAYLRSLRGSYRRFAEAYEALCYKLDVKPSLPDNSTRLPIAFMKTCNWIESERTKLLYPPKSLECVKLTGHGSDVAKSLHRMKDLRLDEFKGYPKYIQQSLIRLGVYSMLSRAGYDTAPVEETMAEDSKICEDILQGRQLLFSPYQTLRHQAVDEALGIERETSGVQSRPKVLPGMYPIDSGTHPTDSDMHRTSSDMHRGDSVIQDILLNVNAHTPSRDADQETRDFISRVLALKQCGASKQTIITKFFDESITAKQTSFYPFVAMLFRVMGLNCQASRQGDNGARWDAMIADPEESIPIEIKSPTEELNLSLKAIRQAVENKVILLSRKTHPTRPETTSLAVGYYLPNDRAEVTNLLKDFKAAYGFSLGVIDLKTLLTIAVTIVFDEKTFDIQKLNRLEGFANAAFN